MACRNGSPAMTVMMLPFLDAKQKAIASAAGLVGLAGVLTIGFVHPIPVLAGLVALVGVAAVLLLPIPTLVVGLFLVPFHTLAFAFMQNREHLATVPLTFWKDALIIGLFLRAVGERFWSERRLRLPRAPADNFLLVYIVAYGILAVASPSGPTVARALGRSIEGPLLFLTIRYLRPSRRQLWYCVTAILAAATVMGVVALIERLGPRQGL